MKMRNDIIRKVHHTRGIGMWHCSECETLIENYDKAKADNFKGWVLHHRRETHYPNGERMMIEISAKELNALDMYKNRPANELIYMTASEHTSLHSKGKRHSEETKKKLSEAAKQRPKENYKGENNGMYGKKHSEESKRKMTESRKGRRWFNNGIIEKFCYERPNGYKPGRLKHK